MRPRSAFATSLTSLGCTASSGFSTAVQEKKRKMTLRSGSAAGGRASYRARRWSCVLSAVICLTWHVKSR